MLFRSGNRYEKVEETSLPLLSLIPDIPLYLSFYELYDESVLASEAYQINRNSRAPGMRPEWTKRMMTYLTRIMGGTYQPLTDTWLAGPERSDHTIWALFINPVDGQNATVDLWYKERLLPSLQNSGVVTACRLFGTNAVPPKVESQVQRADGPQRVVLTAVRNGTVATAIPYDTWAAVSGDVSSATGVLYRRMPL